MDLPDRALVLAADVDRALADHLGPAVARLRDLDASLGPLGDELEAFTAAGKRLRPVLLLLGHGAAGGDPGDVVGPAVAIELLHTCALLHDDVIDAASERRGRATTHVAFAARHRARSLAGDPDAYGRAMAILLGDLAFTAADDAFLTADVSADRLLAGLRWFGRLREEVMAGQALDVEAAATRAVDRGTALRIATLKSGRYSVTRPLQIGAVLAGADEALLAGLEAVGEPLGRAFQLRDDLLGVFGDMAETGKSATGDLAEGKRTLLVAEAWARLDDAGRAELQAGLGDPGLTPSGAERLRGLLDGSGARAAVDERIRHEAATAAAALDDLPVTAEAAEVLRSLVGWFVHRRA